MDDSHIIRLGVYLTLGSSLAFIISSIVIGFLKSSVYAGAIRMWLRCLVTCFYVGLVILLASALGSIVQNTVKGIRCK
jgi:hypothetical protein